MIMMTKIINTQIQRIIHHHHQSGLSTGATGVVVEVGGLTVGFELLHSDQSIAELRMCVN